MKVVIIYDGQMTKKKKSTSIFQSYDSF